jgi:putative hydrolase of the HAD superfamily
MASISKLPPVDTVIFDVDDTLYPLGTGLQKACGLNIQAFMVERLGFPPETAADDCARMYKQFGTTMGGLVQEGYIFDFDDYHSIAHGRLPYQNLQRDPTLRQILLSMPQRRMIFSNANDVHIAEALKRLGIEDCFERIISFEAVMNYENRQTVKQAADAWKAVIESRIGTVGGGVPPGLKEPEVVDSSGCFACGVNPFVSRAARIRKAGASVHGGNSVHGGTSMPCPRPEMPEIICKPQLLAFERAIKIAGCNPKTAMFFDDSIKNIAGAKAAGLQTCLVGKTELCAGADYALASLHNLKAGIPCLWGGAADSEVERIAVPSSMGTEIQVSAA